MTEFRGDPLLQSAVDLIASFGVDGRPCLVSLRDRALVVTALATMRAGAVAFNEYGVLIDPASDLGVGMGAAETIAPGGAMRIYDTLLAWDEALPDLKMPSFPPMTDDGRPTNTPLGPAAVKHVLDRRLGAPLACTLTATTETRSLIHQIAGERANWCNVV